MGGMSDFKYFGTQYSYEVRSIPAALLPNVIQPNGNSLARSSIHSTKAGPVPKL